MPAEKVNLKCMTYANSRPKPAITSKSQKSEWSALFKYVCILLVMKEAVDQINDDEML